VIVCFVGVGGVVLVWLACVWLFDRLFIKKVSLTVPVTLLPLCFDRSLGRLSGRLLGPSITPKNATLALHQTAADILFRRVFGRYQLRSYII
jgi:hypothetical protein